MQSRWEGDYFGKVPKSTILLRARKLSHTVGGWSRLLKAGLATEQEVIDLRKW